MRDHDIDFMKLALKCAGRCSPEDGRVHPMVGAVVAREKALLATAYRGELQPGDHAEFTAMEGKLPHTTLAGATVYTTLEPCTTRHHPNLPCAEWLIQRKVARVVIGMLDPNQAITGKGIRRLRDANIATDFFPSEFMAEAEEQNRHFILSQEGKAVIGGVIRGRSDVVKAMEKLCLRADKNIRLLVHALGMKYKIPQAFAETLAAYMKAREVEGRPVRFWPIIVVDREMNVQDFLSNIAARANIYSQHKVDHCITPRFARSDSPVGIDVLIIDKSHALLSFTTTVGSQQTEIGLSLEQHPTLLAELVDWFEHFVGKRAVSLEEFRTRIDAEIGKPPVLE